MMPRCTPPLLDAHGRTPMDYKDGDKTRFEQLKETHPKLWNYVMHTLGLRDVLFYCRENTSMPSLARRIRWGEE